MRIQLSNVGVINKCDIEFVPGINLIIGASGSGKSTLMNMLGCLDVPTQGEYILDGRQIRKMSDNELAKIRNEKIGFVFQGFNLLPKLTAIENVELPLIYQSISPKERRKRAQKALDSVGLRRKG